MLKIGLLFSCFIAFIKIHAQECAHVQKLSSQQEIKLKTLVSELEIALKNENLEEIDSINSTIKLTLNSEAGKPENIEKYIQLPQNSTWLNENEAILLARKLVDKDSNIYSSLWKTALGMSPPNYLPNSIFLRTSAEYALGLLQISEKETDLKRKEKYRSWALKTLDSLLTKQLPSGAFPFPDLRPYNDPVFSPIINRFMLYCGSDSVNVLKNGWIIDDKNTGEFKFDAGVIANSFYEAFLYTNELKYKESVIKTAKYLLALPFNSNYNYNSFAALGLLRGYELTQDSSYFKRAINTIRYSVTPGQLENGRWADGHNAKSVYHGIMIENITPLTPYLNQNNGIHKYISTTLNLAISNIMKQTLNCGASTSFNWLLTSYHFNQNNDSLKNLIGQHIQLAQTKGNFLDVPTLGKCLNLLDATLSLDKQEKNIKLYPNPCDNFFYYDFVEQVTEIKLMTLQGEVVKIEQPLQNSGKFETQNLENGTFIIEFTYSNSVKTWGKIIVQR